MTMATNGAIPSELQADPQAPANCHHQGAELAQRAQLEAPQRPLAGPSGPVASESSSLAIEPPAGAQRGSSNKPRKQSLDELSGRKLSIQVELSGERNDPQLIGNPGNQALNLVGAAANGPASGAATRSRLGPVKSLDNLDNNSKLANDNLGPPSVKLEPASGQQLGASQRKQRPSSSDQATGAGQAKQHMFSFKQLAINSRNLASSKKRDLQQQQQQQQQPNQQQQQQQQPQTPPTRISSKCKQLIRLKSSKTLEIRGEPANSSSDSSSDTNNGQLVARRRSSTAEPADSNNLPGFGAPLAPGSELEAGGQLGEVKPSDLDNGSELGDDNDDDDDEYEFESYDDDDQDEEDLDEQLDSQEEFRSGEAATRAANPGPKASRPLASSRMLHPLPSLGVELKRRHKRRLAPKSRQTQPLAPHLRPIRSGTCKSCEPFINRIDLDGLPVTDVDLVTYKHLCQLEHEARHHRRNYNANFHHHQGQLRGPASLSLAATTAGQPPALPSVGQVQPRPQSDSACVGHRPRLRPSPGPGRAGQTRAPLAAIASIGRRSSLQEESGAYYQLCTQPEEQLIRQKYIWYPPALRSLALVDQFFDSFAPEKIPLVNPLAATVGQQQPQPQQQQLAPIGGPPTMGAASVGAKPSQHPASSLAGGYRDEQISFQLPRQDISLDYCSYPLNEAGRASYLQFIDKRNSQALDVATVAQIKPPQAAPLATGPPFGAATRQQQQQQTTDDSGPKQPGSPATREGSLALLAPGPGPPPVMGQRCRRCLVRFGAHQLVVVAPNFIIGSKLAASGPGSSSALASGPMLSQATVELLAGGSAAQPGPAPASSQRRASIVSSASCLTLQENVSCSPGGAASASKENPDKQPTTTTTPPPAPKWPCCHPLASSANQQLLQPQIQQRQSAAMFHPQCFTCSTCKEFLVDLVYCLRDNKLYCLRHYGDSLRPRCDWCQELIFSDEYLKAMNENFHVDHFLCRNCDSNLAGKRYVLKEEKPYCIQCYEDNFANTCEDCKRPIGIDSKDLSYKERHWHDSCFTCQSCNQSLINKPFGCKADKVYCGECYDMKFATRCDGCKNPFRAGSKKMEYKGRQWHDSCFCCNICQNTIGSNSFIPKDDEIYCIKCYEDKYATRCVKCKLVIVSGGVNYRNEPWHRECFTCCNCDKSLAGQRFTTRDANNSETMAKQLSDKTNQQQASHNAYCIDCYGELFAKKCYACMKPITGRGGTRFVTFEERSWHNDCFICNDCETSLVGKGFITDGPDTILCGECARAKLR